MSSKKIYFAMGIHCHQPVGNFTSVLDEAYEKAYLPVLECLQRHPYAKVALHYSGPLWDYYLKNRPKWIEIIRNLVRKGQIEMLSGAYYEPILPGIADRDKIAQIKKMNRVIRRETGATAAGMWCAERVWEPYLAKPISLGDIRYTILDETHFNRVGLNQKDLYGYYVTEEQGHALSVLPINYDLRHIINGGTPEEAIEYLRSKAHESEDRLLVFADDGEKFGLWPNTYQKTWQEGWMDRFFELLRENSSWIKMVNFSEYMQDFPPLGRVYLPASSYFEMSHWSLPAPAASEMERLMSRFRKEGNWEALSSFISGGFWRNFLVKYPESNRMQKKALYISEKIDHMTGPNKTDARTELFKGQCNCAYWHGWFGGIYLPHLRQGIQSSLIRAEKYADDEYNRNQAYKEIEKIDINRDLQDEVIVNTKNLQMSFEPASGGALYELNYKPAAINLCDTMTRRPEVYHKGIDGGMDLKYDSYQRLSFIEHFLAPSQSLAAFEAGNFEELGDFVEKPYEVFTSEKDDKAALTLFRKGSVLWRGEFLPVEVEKTFLVPEDGKSFSVQYWLINDSNQDFELDFACEMNFSFLSSDENSNFMTFGSEGEENSEEGGKRRFLSQIESHDNVDNIVLNDGQRGYRLRIDLGQDAKLWHFPIETVSMSESGPEKVFQSTIIMPLWRLRLKAGETWDNTISVVLEEVAPKSVEEPDLAVLDSIK